MNDTERSLAILSERVRELEQRLAELQAELKNSDSAVLKMENELCNAVEWSEKLERELAELRKPAGEIQAKAYERCARYVIPTSQYLATRFREWAAEARNK